MGDSVKNGGAKGGVFWSTVNGGASVVLPFLVFSLFARMMTPAALAPVMLAVAMVELLKSIGPLGIYDVLVARREDEIVYQRTASAVFLLGGLAVATIYCGLVIVSPWILELRLPAVLLVLAVKALCDYLVMQPQAVLVQRGAIARLGSRGALAGLIAGLIGVAIGRFGSPLVGLTAYYVLQSLIALLMTTIGTDAVARPELDRDAARDMGWQGIRASGVRMTAGVSNYLDQLLLGAMAPASAVGPYNLGKRLEVVSMTLGSSFSQLLFQPNFARAVPGERATHLSQGVAAISLVCGVPIVVFDIFHAQAVPLLFGWQWQSAAPIAAILATSGLVRAIGGVAGALYTVTGRNGRLLAMSTLGAATNMLMIVLFARYGVFWAAAAILTRNIAQTVAMFALTRDVDGHLIRLFARCCLGPLAAAALAAFIAGRAMRALVGTSGPIETLAMLAVAGSTAMAVGFLLLRWSGRADFVGGREQRDLIP